MLFPKRLLHSAVKAAKNFAELNVLPRRMSFLRHGPSEANVTRELKEKGKIKDYPPKYLETPDREMRLENSFGTKYPVVAGAWILKNCPRFTVAQASDHVRAYETAGRLGLSLQWSIDCFYGERH